MDKIIKTVGEYLESRQQTISKNKFDMLKKTLEGIPEETKVLWGYFPGKSEKADNSDGKPTTIDLISTIDVDRDNEVLIPEGCDLSGYKKTPTVLFGHNYNSIPVGVSKWQKIADQGINSRTEYFSSDFARDVHEAAINGALANSVGFIPKKWVTNPDAKNGGLFLNDEDEEKQREKYEAVRTKYGIKGKPDRIFTDWHLLEYSKVPVAANPHAITMAMKMAKTEQMKDWLKQELEGILEKRICGKRDLPVSDKEKWDGAAVRKRIEAWATSGEDINWKKYEQAFVYVDPEKADTKGGYKLPFADIVDGKLTAVWGGVSAAMGALLGARGGVDMPDNERKPAYNFLAAYYKKLDKEPPEFKEYTEEELGKMFPEESNEPALVECQNCHKLIDYGKEPEAGQGYIKCPECGAFIDQTGKVQVTKRTIYLFGTIDSNTAKQISEQLIGFDRQSQEPIQIIIGSYGGEVYPAFSIIDTIKAMKSPVETVGMGMVMSAGLLIFMTGNTRKISSNASVLSHRFWGGLIGTQAELVAGRVEHDRLHQRIIDIYKEHTRLKTNEEVLNNLLKETDVWLTAQQAVEYGIADQVLQKDDFTKSVNKEEVVSKMFDGFKQKAITKGGGTAMTICQQCKTEFVYSAEPEVGTGYVKCPHCKAEVNQEGNVRLGDKFLSAEQLDEYYEKLSLSDILTGFKKTEMIVEIAEKIVLKKVRKMLESEEQAEDRNNDDKQKKTSEGKEKTNPEGPKTDDDSQPEADGIEGVDMNGSEIKTDGKKTETIKGLIFENPKPEEISDEDAKKIIAAMDAVFEKKVNRVLGRV